MPSQKFLEAVAAREADRLAREAAEQAAAAAEGTVTDSSDPMAQFVPTDEQARSEEDAEMDRIMDVITIRVAYEKWCGKSRVDVRPGQTESIKVSCPWPEHTDTHASASLNIDKQVFMCHGTCDKGGDKYDLAAIRFGFDLHTYKQGENFHRLRRAMAESIGYQFQRVPGRKTYAIEKPEQLDETPDLGEDTSQQEPVAEDPAPTAAPLTVVVPLHSEDESDDEFFYKQAILVDYKNFIKPDTFLDVWVRQLRGSDEPDDYHFWHGLLALGMAVGHTVQLADRKSPVHANLSVCLVGPSGAGKSRARRHITTLFEATDLGFNPQNEPPTGIKVIKGPGSGEMLIKYFEHIYCPDPSFPKQMDLASIRGLIDFDEFSSIIAMCSRKGSVFKEVLMSIYDCDPMVVAASLTTGEKKAREPFGSVVTTTQPRSLKGLVTERSLVSGFANRFIFASGLPKKTDEWGDYEPDISPAFDLFRAICMWAQSSAILNPEGLRIQVTPDARIYGNDFFEKHITPIERKDNTGLLGRLRLTVKKLLLLTAINERCEGITPEMMERTFSILPYLLRTAGASSAHIGESTDQEIVRHILEAIIRREKTHPGKGTAANDIREMYRRQKFELADVNKALKGLIEMGEIEKVESQRGPGRPTVRFRIAQ